MGILLGGLQRGLCQQAGASAAFSGGHAHPPLQKCRTRKKGAVQYFSEPHASNSSSQYVINAIKYIQFNYSHDISIDDIAKAVGVSRSHLYRVFMSNVGQSPIDYLTSYRISEACFLLKNSQLSIAEIAVSVGFFDQFYFSRVFKKSKGVPPSKYLTSINQEKAAR